MNTISVETLQRWLEEGRPITVIDIRHTKDREEWYIPGSLHLDIYDAVAARDPSVLAGLNFPLDEAIVLVCNMGVTAAIAAELLNQRGVKAYVLEGGMQAWSLAYNTAEVPFEEGVEILQVRRTGKGCLSYMIGSEKEAAVIDPSVEAQVYQALAQQRGWTIRAVIDTHVHADHISRALTLARQTGATLYLPEQNRVHYAFTPLHEGDSLDFGRAHLIACRTPGHTEESTCYLLNHKALFTGDTLFLDAVGRPDLHTDVEEARRRAELLYDSLLRLQSLPPSTLILPGHTDRPIPFDGHPLVRTLGEIYQTTPLLKERDKQTFVDTILARIPPTPPNYLEIIRINESGSLETLEKPVTELEAGANRCAVH
ncbi:Zn-dependent hydrolase, glyoxylase [Chthonomonas calidirosea]|uniref:Zn-dependent hydrolases, including glyoxylases n=1 Tax=Chthonomonas calidirosea (strain DSM 23976 / ICMP 18418 / T49) TaxID=1303518 RepID=S0EUR5_CHTCT|nr:MBL fold metallo-hydrolase [Chthonomonas calidirosea]CCW35442.1 Zn-dependent hydrolases, including glyoxylases [Chthonomonas calidirosea T49]CEK20265.1 Zn-dependent hydrolase, glyoxylase [Chthonomonas calidirosea]